jgi:hypothetical protein
MKRRTFSDSAAATVGAAAFAFGRAFTAVSAVTANVMAVTGDDREILLNADIDPEAGAAGRGIRT